MVLVRRRALSVALLTVASGMLALGVGSGASAAPAPLVGTFRITAGACASGASGSYFRMILPTGNASGPFIQNADSACGDHTYTLLSPGTDGGLVTGSTQPAPNPGFDAKRNSLAVRVIRPVRFFGVDFSGSTNAKDLQTAQATKVPTLLADGGKLSGDLSAFDATWNAQSFNQGSPKPDGSSPGITSAPTGTYDAATGRYSLTWTSQIVGGPFDKFTGLWHLEGTFVPAGSGAVAAPSGATATTTAAVAPAAGADGGTAVTTPAGQVASPAAPAAAATPTKGRSASSVHVADDGFEAPVWLVLGLAGVGILAVISLLVLGRRPDELAG